MTFHLFDLLCQHTRPTRLDLLCQHTQPTQHTNLQNFLLMLFFVPTNKFGFKIVLLKLEMSAIEGEFRKIPKLFKSST